MIDNAQSKLNCLFSALSCAARRAILAQLLENDQTVKQLAAPHDISMAMISRHLKILVRAGLVSQIKRGREKICRLEPEALADANTWMQEFGYFSEQAFDDLEANLVAMGLTDP